MKSVYTKILSVALIFLFVSTNTLFLYPKKTEAQAGAVASCTAGYAAALIARMTGAATDIIGVPKSQPGDSSTGQLGSGSSNALSFNNCILKPLAQQMLVALVRQIGASVVEWVNSGFDGKPLFVTDFEGLLTDTADGVIGNFIEGSELGWLCSDFSAQIRLSLALKYSKPTREKFRCTVSDIANNAENFLEDNGGRGWDNWLALTTQPQNNVYGAYFTAQGELAQRVAAKLNDKTQEVQRNAGFLNFTYCEEMETVDDAIARVNGATSPYEVGGSNLQTTTQPTPECKPGKTKTGTPGSIIGSKLSSVINQSEVQLAVAQEIDQVIGAVLNQLTQKAISGAQGILGLSKKKSANTGSSYLAKYRQELYGVNPTGSAVVIGATSEIEDYRINSYEEALGLINTDPSTQRILDITNQSAQEASDAQSKTQNEIENSLGFNNTERNTALLTSANQSSSGPGSASNAVNGIKEGNVTTYMPPAITGEEQDPWWQTNLGRNTAIKEVRIWRVTNKPVSQTLEQIQVIVYDENDNQVWQSSPLFPNESSPNPIIVPVGISGSKVRIQKFGTLDYQCRETFSFEGFSEYESCYRPLELVEVEVIETVTPPAGSGFGTSTIPTNPSGNVGAGSGQQTGGASVAMQSNSTVTSSAPLNYTSTVSSASSRSGIRVETNLQTSGGAPVSFSSVFGSLDLYHGRQNGTLSLVSITGTTESSIVIQGMSLDPNNGYRINLNGTKRVGVSGNYVIEVRVLDSAGNNLTTQRINFVVQ
jgi:hypothetical protein